MAVVRKKQDDKFLKVLRELVTTGGGNRQCFDCGQKGPTYVNMTIGSFVCTRCSGVLRGITPPHRVKSISMATFTQEEIDFLKAHGNDLCAKTWLGLWDPKRAVHQDHRELMIDKYERKRYYLEPASPLKSLTNAASLKASSNSSNNHNSHNSSSASSTHTTLSNGYGNHHSSSNNSNHSSAISSSGNNKMSSSDSSFPNITLTPPTSQRTSQNGLHKSSSTAISRPQQNGFHHQQHHHHDVFMTNNNSNNNNGLNGLSGLNVSIGSGSTSTGALSDTSSCTSNGFGPDADFVADFGSAYIFDATSAGGSVGSPAVSSASSVASSNGYAKIQPIKAAQFMNGGVNNGGVGATSAAQLMMNGNNGQAANARNHQNGSHNGTNNNNNSTENFADFDHAPIFNAIGFPMTNGNNTHGTGSSSASATSANNNNKLPAEDRYAALKDLDEQLRESKAAVAAAATVVAPTVVDSFGNNNNGHVNPFKSQQQQNGAIVNPFQAAQQQQQQQNLFGQMSTLQNGLMTNGFGGVMQQQQQQQLQQPHQTPVSAQQTPPQQTAFFNFSNGFTTGATAAMFPAPVSSGPNGCGFGFGSMQQQIAATAGGGPFNNPFAATGAMNSNNPFL